MTRDDEVQSQLTLRLWYFERVHEWFILDVSISENHRMVRVGGDFKDHLVPTPLP